MYGDGYVLHFISYCFGGGDDAHSILDYYELTMIT